MAQRPRVVIAGAGFGGLRCARALAGKPADVLLIDRNNYHLFTPLLYQVASSLLNPSDIAFPIRQVFRRVPNVRFRLAEIEDVEFKEKRIKTTEGALIPYDYLVLAVGSETNYFNLSSQSRWTYGLKDLPESITLRGHILNCFERAAQESDPVRRQAWLTFVVAGAGPTGVEYAGALSELIRLVLARDFKEVDTQLTRILLVEAAQRVLPPFPEKLSRNAEAVLHQLGVETLTAKAVKEIGPHKVILADGTAIETRTVVWAAGVRPGKLVQKLQVPKTRGGRIVVDEFLRIPGCEGAFAIGDSAAFIQNGRELAMMAPQAMQEAGYAAGSVLRLSAGLPLQPFRFRNWGSMATIGRNSAVAHVGKVQLTGFAGWIAWMFLHLIKLIGFRNRISVLAEWGWYYFLYDRPVRLIYRLPSSDS